jgi:hypothetical protein
MNKLFLSFEKSVAFKILSCLFNFSTLKYVSFFMLVVVVYGQFKIKKTRKLRHEAWGMRTEAWRMCNKTHYVLIAHCFITMLHCFITFLLPYSIIWSYPTVTFHSIHIFPWQLRCSLFGPPVYYISNPDQACFKWQFFNKTIKLRCMRCLRCMSVD